jgi:hypothetical protein
MKQMGLHADLLTSHKKLSLLVENLSNLESRFLDSLIASAEEDLPDALEVLAVDVEALVEHPPQRRVRLVDLDGLVPHGRQE